MPWLLNCIYAILLLVSTPWLLWRRCTQGRYRQGWSQKLFGNLPSLPNSKGDLGSIEPTLWFHAVSVGELQVIRPLVERATSELPAARILITTSTDSGYELAKKLYPQHTVSFAPLDFSWSISRALDRVQPDLIILAELEVWPNWISFAHKRQIPIAIINGRLSEKSMKGYLRVAPFVRSLMNKVAWVGAQSDTIRDRFLRLGSPPDRVHMVGNLKFDGANHDRKHPEVLQRAEQLGLLSNPQASEVGTGSTQTQRSDLQANRPMVWICGSTQDPEERICLDTFCELIDRFPHLRLILVPRHAERFEEVAKLVRDKRVAWGRRSRMADEPLDPNWKVFLADSVGELRWWWGLADLGFVGGSFGARGGQNMIEPCAYSVAVCFGPNTRNFADVVQILLDAEAATQLASPEELKPWVVRMIEDSPTRSLTARRAESITSEHRGATERTWKQLAVLVQRQVQSTAP